MPKLHQEGFTDHTSPITINDLNVDKVWTGKYPQYVVHFTFINCPHIPPGSFNWKQTTTDRYTWVCLQAKKIGGEKFHNNQYYGGGILFKGKKPNQIVSAVNKLNADIVKSYRQGELSTENPFATKLSERSEKLPF